MPLHKHGFMCLPLCLQKDDFIFTRLALQPGACESYSDNDLVLLCKQNPMVRGWEGIGLGRRGVHGCGLRSCIAPIQQAEATGACKGTGWICSVCFVISWPTPQHHA